MSWFVSVIIGHLLNALGFILNKAALNVAIQNAGAFTFYVGFLGLLSLVLSPLGMEVPSGIDEWLPLLIGGTTFMLALWCFISALSTTATSRVAPFIGALIPIFTYGFEYLFSGTILTGYLLSAFVILIIGTTVITLDLDATSKKSKRRFTKANILPWVYGTVAALAFAASFVASKVAYDAQPFWSAFIWMRLISAAAVLLFLFFPVIRKAIWQSRKIFFTKPGAIYLSSQIVGAASFIFINYALTQAPASLVNAMQGVQYAFLIVLVLVGQVVAPKLVAESMGRRTLIVRSLGVVIISAGLALVAYSQ